MSENGILSKEEIEVHLDNLQMWHLKENQIVKELATSNFVSAIGLLNSIAVLSETCNHHPDLMIYGWNKVRITLSTKDKGGLTIKDINLAKQIDNIKID